MILWWWMISIPGLNTPNEISQQHKGHSRRRLPTPFSYHKSFAVLSIQIQNICGQCHTHKKHDPSPVPQFNQSLSDWHFECCTLSLNELGVGGTPIDRMKGNEIRNNNHTHRTTHGELMYLHFRQWKYWQLETHRLLIATLMMQWKVYRSSWS